MRPCNPLQLLIPDPGSAPRVALILLNSLTGLSLAPVVAVRGGTGHTLLAMMQISESYNQKNSLFNAMNRFIGAVNNMDQTVMVPSLLRDVPLDDAPDLKEVRSAADSGGGGGGGGGDYFQPDADMYSSYILLKSIRNDIEWGVLKAAEVVEAPRADVEEDDDLEKQFYFHLKGLHAVLSKLTRKANTLTTRYKEEIGCRN